ncbi:D-alanyl-D-alanine carboxypeptidase [candidate division KSB3 bacterium]|uniref:D-alanyl-D-alanine carboxypeptidase n=1 Tax=candidate division KSB3 bacterium TaxID=2044937 RepID=A0A2G6E2U1_9BACT|nr:MAG: D-alanyl-D-alanine carboxypeptidase [candidate division KSB3 bacterium]PIE28675.1 MAG: D-alanyl-D-alanine carboxypeptidase [candidate division KSB3 bacterium]
MYRQIRSLLKVAMLPVFFLTVFIHVSAADAAAKTRPYKSAVLMDYDSGRVLQEENAHEQVIPASLVKMMVLLLTMEQLEAGQIQLSDEVTASAWAAHMGGQQVHLAKGETFTLGKLLDAMVIASANDAAVAVAEHLAGNVKNCVKMMNARARAIGMKNTVFANVHGLPAGKGQTDDLTSAYDIAVLGRYLLKNYPQVLDWTSTYTAPFRDGEMTLVNTNKYLLRNVPGVDGLKTGYHRRAGFNVCVTATHEKRRMIAVVMGAPSKIDRNKKAKDLLAAGFNTKSKADRL